MKVELRHRVGALDERVSSASGTWTEREGIALRVEVDGRVGWGEASPLPGYGHGDDLASARAALERFARSAAAPDLAAPVRSWLPRLLAGLEDSASAGFAVETALLSLASSTAGVPVHRLLSPRAARPVPLCTLLPADPDAASAAVREAVAASVRCFKLKIGRRLDVEIALLRRLRAEHGSDVTLRVDASGSLVDPMPALSALAALGVEMVEEPVAGDALLALSDSPVPIAVDESIHGAAGAARLERLLATGRCDVVVLKPAALGGALTCMRLAALARRHGADVVVSHLLDGPIALAACAELALALGGDRAAGLGPHAGLRAWPPLPRPWLVRGCVAPRPVAAPAVEPPASWPDDRPAASVARARDDLDVRAAARREPAREAIVTDARATDFEELAARARARAETLHAAGARPDRLVGLVGHPDEETLVTLHALIAGRVPFVALHPRATPAERAEVIARAGVALVLDGPRATAGPGGRVAPPDTLAVVSTSGSSGCPRDVVLSRSAFVASAWASERNLGWRDDDRWLLCLSLGHVGGLSVPIRALLGRRAVVLGPAGAFDPGAVTSALSRHRVTLASLVPSMLDRMLDAGLRAPPALRAALLGGAACPARLLARAERAGVRALTTYGMTETCGQVATRRPGTPPTAAGGAGAPLPGVSIRIVDGEIRVRGPMVARRTLDGRPLAPGGWLATGDAGRIDAEGRLHVLGRRDDRIVTGGENVHPLEVERALEALPGVRAACVFGVPDDRYGERVAAAIVADGPAPSDAALLAGMRASLAPFKRPRAVAYVDAIEVTPSGKPSRAGTRGRALPELRPLSAR